MSDPRYECRICHERFAKRGALRSHMSGHDQLKRREEVQHAQQLHGCTPMARQTLQKIFDAIFGRNQSSSRGAGAELSPKSGPEFEARRASRPDSGRPPLPPKMSFDSTRPPISGLELGHDHTSQEIHGGSIQQPRMQQALSKPSDNSDNQVPLPHEFKDPASGQDPVTSSSSLFSSESLNSNFASLPPSPILTNPIPVPMIENSIMANLRQESFLLPDLVRITSGSAASGSFAVLPDQEGLNILHQHQNQQDPVEAPQSPSQGN